MSIRKNEFNDVVEKVIPDVNQRLRVSLVADDSKRDRPRSTSTHTKSGGFRRFD
ncbi:MAG: hypothetical protein R3B13_11080 [Polyangiaceae bacterium]